MSLQLIYQFQETTNNIEIGCLYPIEWYCDCKKGDPIILVYFMTVTSEKRREFEEVIRAWAAQPQTHNVDVSSINLDQLRDWCENNTNSPDYPIEFAEFKKLVTEFPHRISSIMYIPDNV